MPRFRLSIDTNYRRVAESANDAQHAVRVIIHSPHRRATTRTLFLTGTLTLVLVGGAAIGLLR